MSYSTWARSSISSDHQSTLCGLCMPATCDRVTLLHREVRAGGTWLGIFRLGYCTGNLSHLFFPVAPWLLHGMGRVQGTLSALQFTYQMLNKQGWEARCQMLTLPDAASSLYRVDKICPPMLAGMRKGIQIGTCMLSFLSKSECGCRNGAKQCFHPWIMSLRVHASPAVALKLVSVSLLHTTRCI